MVCLPLNESWTDSKWERYMKHTITAPEDDYRLKERREGGMDGGRAGWMEGGKKERRRVETLSQCHRAEQPRETLQSHLGGFLDGVMVLLHSREVTQKQSIYLHTLHPVFQQTASH